jgi:anti-sigma factor RsiW
VSHPAELLSAYLDGEITPDERRRVVEHLARCGTCYVDLESLQAARAALRSLPILDLPVDLMPRERHRVVPLRRRPAVWVGAAAAAAAAFVALATTFAPAPGLNVTVNDLSRPASARASIDPSFSSAKVVLPPLPTFPEAGQ